MAAKKGHLAVIGDPIAHSLSPLMQNAALRDLGIPLFYKKIHVTPKGLKKFLKGEARHLAGFNITIPHKEKMVSQLDYVTPKAKVIGAVNTVVRVGDKLVGFNTDGDGYLESLKRDLKFSPRGKIILLLGAGGAARAIAVSLAMAQAKGITIANRTPRRARQLVKDLRRHFKKTSFFSCDIKGSVFLRALRSCHLLTNTTTIGLRGTLFPDFPWNQLERKTLLSDIVYTPRLTPFLKEGKARGHRILTGEGMLVYQGALAFELWTGKKPDTRLMRKVILKKLRGVKRE